ncbi:dTDP-4-dehydrorhamnose 3,5-epimerase [Paenibacillus allorhizosphaerae]|uniref:dTDP-4-dehydrorhamnose 3,5-epimerase n=1 Tax=Paenibacillus allorhizosphaerae TaxID=2849866 RepID=A0ABM8VV13_9BACL|nr:dTDP-4-dehydrorhamnose 3,5-epimerase [Paenibacillus allorhizosphaerae]CAG7659168.1 dTDP-4-dehydrorhamnose 3,5-epimerase [Paenibacillus allorhizosphaerae]
MRTVETPFAGVYIIEPQVHGDQRGFFMESYNNRTFQQLGFNHTFVQDNHSLSIEAGTIRGLHYQNSPMAQTKLVRVIAGAIYDVVVDLRKTSSTFGQWMSVILSESNKRQLLVPVGFAHGFCTITSNTQVIYKVDELYSPQLDRGILWNDPELNIDWPTSIPILSDKDNMHPLLKDADIYFD